MKGSNTATTTNKAKILVVDDDASIRSTLAMLLTDEGYEVSTAVNGFDALLQLRHSVPNVITSNLGMPLMSGFEFLSVIRRRFPHICVIVVSGAFNHADQVPGGVIADAFYPKGQHEPQALLDGIAELIRTSNARPREQQSRTNAPPAQRRGAHGISASIDQRPRCAIAPVAKHVSKARKMQISSGARKVTAEAGLHRTVDRGRIAHVVGQHSSRIAKQPVSC